jgi:hypothetical protein
LRDVTEFQIVLEIVGQEGVEPDELEATAEAVLEGVERHTAFVALGPVVSVDFSRRAIEIECHVAGENSDDVHSKMARIMEVMLDAANSFEYEGSTAKKLEPVPA